MLFFSSATPSSHPIIPHPIPSSHPIIPHPTPSSHPLIPHPTPPSHPLIPPPTPPPHPPNPPPPPPPPTPPSCFSLSHLATSTAPDLSLLSLAEMLKLEVRAPSILNTTASMCGGTTNRLQLVVVWSPLQIKTNEITTLLRTNPFNLI